MVGSNGTVISLRRGRTTIAPSFRLIRKLRFFTNGRKYRKVQLSKGAKGRKNFYVHRLVAEAFLAPDLERTHVNHKDYDTSNNGVDNLEWVTQQENNAHQWRRK